MLETLQTCRGFCTCKAVNTSRASETFYLSLSSLVFLVFQHATSGVFSQETFVPDHLTVSGALEQEKHDSQLKTNFFCSGIINQMYKQSQH